MRRVRDRCNRARNWARPKKHRASAGPCGRARAPVSRGRCSDTRRSARRRHGRRARRSAITPRSLLRRRGGTQRESGRSSANSARREADCCCPSLARSRASVYCCSVGVSSIDGGALPVSVIAHRPVELPAVASRQLPPGSCLQTWPRSTGLFPWLCFNVGSVIWVARASHPVRFLLSRSSRSRARWRRVFSPVPPAPQSMG